MAETMTFTGFSPASASREAIYEIGSLDGGPGVVREIADAYDYTLSEVPDEVNLGGLIKVVGPAKTLQDNIASVQDKLGTDKNALELARSWAVRSGLLVPVSRDFLTGAPIQDEHDSVVLTGGVRNWMERRAERLALLVKEGHRIGRVALVGGNRVMRTSEGLGVEEGMTEADYLAARIAPRLVAIGLEHEVYPVESAKGDDVMAVALTALEGSANPLFVANAGYWVQGAGQLLRAMQGGGIGRGLDVVSDSFLLGKTGEEPTSTHQNPFSALGQILRNLQELTRHAKA